MTWLHLQMTLLDAAAAVVGFAVNWLLQSTLLIAAGLAAAWLLRRRGSAVQSAVYRTTLAAAIVCPLATSLLALGGVSGWALETPAAFTYERASGGPQERAEPASVVAAAWASNAEPTEAASAPLGPAPMSAEAAASGLAPSPQQASLRPWPADAAAIDPIASGGDPAPAAAAVPTRPPRTVTVPVETWRFQVHRFGLVAVGICLAWLAGSGLLLVRLAIAWRRLDQLCRGAACAEEPTQQTCRELANLLAVAPPEVLRSPYLTSPCLARLVRPVVLLPAADLALPLRDVLIHELAHLRRLDCFWNLLRRLATAALFFQPLLWILARRLETSAEEVCDDYVVQYGGDRAEYARRLVDLAELSTIPAGVAIISLRSILSRRVERIMDTSRSLSTRAGNLLLAVVIASGLAGTTIVGFVGLDPQRSRAEAQSASNDATRPPDEKANAATDDQDQEAADDEEQSAPAAAPKTESDQAPPAASKQTNPQTDDKKAKEDRALQGRVVGADGQPVAGARLFWIRSRVHDLRPESPKLVATTDEEGKFRFTPPPGVPENIPASWDYHDRIVVTAPGHGVAFTWPGEIRRYMDASPRLLQALARGGRAGAITLPEAGEPIRGRLVDINGQPVVGAKVRIRWFNEERDGRHLEEEAAARGAENAAWRARIDDLLRVIEPVQLREVLPSAVTDEDGRFELRDIGPKRLVQLLVEGEGIESTDIIARNEPGERIAVELNWGATGETVTAYPNEFLHVVGPSKPVQGRVLDLDTGEPIAGAVVRAFRIHGNRLNSSREREHFATITDTQGRYRITGLPIGEGNELVAFATGDVPYIPVGHAADTSAPGAATELDFRLKRGVWAEGRVFDGQTGKPLTGEISYYFFRNRELEQAIPGLRDAYLDGVYWTNAHGEFRVPVLPSRGVLAYRYSGDAPDRNGIDRFPRGYGAEEIAGSQELGGSNVFPTEPHYLIPENYARVVEIAPAPGQDTVRVDMPLFASRPVTVRAVDAQGKPVTQFQAYGVNERSGWRRIEGPEFEIQDLRPDERRKVFLFHRDRNLAGGGFVEHGAEETVEIRLLEAGSVQGRLIDADGEPIDDAELFANYEKLRSAANSAIWAPHPQLRANPTTIPVDEEGRFRLDGLIPGWTYHARASAPRKFQGQVQSIVIGSPFENVQVEPGERKDLGDVVISAEEPDDRANEKPDDPAEDEPTAAPEHTGGTLEKRLDGRVTFKTIQQPLIFVLDELEKTYKTPVTIDLRRVRVQGVSPQVRISVDVQDVPLREVFQRVLAAAGLDFEVTENGVLVPARRAAATLQGQATGADGKPAAD